MSRNIFIVYLLTFFENSYFWLGTWVFYYLQFTNYAGIGLAEMALIVTVVLGEIPAGAFADLYGRKKALILAFLLLSIGGFIMTFTPNYLWLVIGIIAMGIGVSFFSGSLEALAYDTLKEEKKEHTYNKVIANITSISLIAIALFSAIGGFLHLIDPRIPFFLNAVFCVFGFIAAFFLHEPTIDTSDFSLKQFLLQTKSGAHQLFRTQAVKAISITLLGIGAVTVVLDEMVNDFQSVEFGYDPVALGLLWAVISLIAAIVSKLISRAKWYKATMQTVFVIGLLLALTLIVSPLAGIAFGGIVLLIRFILQMVFINTTSEMVNHMTESRYRATTLSTFNLIQSIPYVVTAYFLGALADVYSAINLAFVIGLILLVFLGFTNGMYKNKKAMLKSE